MDKRKLHHYYTKLRRIRPWYFLITAILFFALGVYNLRQNNLEMIELREAVIQADKNDGNIEKALSDLRNYVYSHMNTDLSSGDFGIEQPIQLTHEYERLKKQADQSVEKRNKEVRDRGESICGQRYPAGGFNSQRVECVQQYIQQNAVESGEVPQELYKFDFVSPKWTPDLAGISLLLGAIFSVVYVLSLIADKWARLKL